MKLCLAATYAKGKAFNFDLKSLNYVLESFYYIKPWQTEQINNVEFFLLDSGAFTFLNKKSSNIDIIDYVDRYADYIKQNNIEYYFELDIDSLIGYSEVKKIRQRLERKTKNKCIPVWHKSRGIKEFKNLCKKYDYVSIGGIATKEITSGEYFLLNSFCDYAHSQNCKIHGLGFTPCDLSNYRFDSVDSTSWIYGGKFGKRNIFSNGKMSTTYPNERLHYLEHDKYNLKQWLLYQEFLKGVNYMNVNSE